MGDPGSQRSSTTHSATTTHNATTQSPPRLAGEQGRPPGALGRWLPLAVAGAVGLVLIGSALYVRGTIADASASATHGQGEALSMASRQAWRLRRTPPDQAALEAFLALHRDKGLRYVGVSAPGPRGELLAEAGEATGTSRVMGQVIDLGLRVRLINPILRQHGPPGHPPPHPQGMRPPHPQGKQPPPPPHPHGKRPPHPHGKRPPPPHGKRPPPHSPPNLILEYEPLPARALARQATTQLAVSGVTAAVVLLLALGLTRSLGQREALRRQLERDRRLAALGEMSAVLAHELRNPLASLKGNAQLLVEQLEQGSRQRDKAGRVVDESVRLEQLINDLLAFVRSGELQRSPVSPRALLQQAADEVSDDRVEVEAGAETKAGLELEIALDRDRMRQALTNVLQNALQASPPQGRVRALARERGKSLQFIIEDQGAGIPPEDLDQIFEPFHTGRVRGTGLGLAITRRIVEQHGGTIRADNRPSPDSGARITISIPRAAGEEQE